MSKIVIQTPNAPAAVATYSQAIIANGFVFVAGQVPLVPETKTLVEGDISDQTRRVLENISAILQAAGTSLANAVKMTVFLTDMNDFAGMNEVYATYFTENPPARSTIQVAGLPLAGARVEIEAIAYL